MPPATPAETVALFVTHRGERCGVYQFGARLYAALSMTSLMRWHYAECADHDEFLSVAERLHPHVVLLNFHPFTLAWASDGVDFPSAMVFSVFHEANQSSIELGQDLPFDVMLCPDPTLLPYDPSYLPVPRFIPALLPDPTGEPVTFSIGSFGFGTPGKGFDRLCAVVNDQFDIARIRINIPPHDSAAMTPHAAIEGIIADCRRHVTKPGIILEITHDFLDEAALLDFLTSNTINAFLYDEAPGRGISSCTDYALASGRPIAVSRSSMFRHLHGVNPSICVEERSLRDIARSGIAPLRHHRTAYASAAAGEVWNRTILDALQSRRDSLGVPDGRGFNKILDDRSRAAYSSALADLRALAPDMLTRKIERANIQQAFALDAARRLADRFVEPRILAVGSYEDTAVASLRTLGYRIDEADPQVNGLDLGAFYCASDTGVAYDLILCTSVLEHVLDDEAFVRMAGELLSLGGIAVFTVDFSNQYPRTGVRPAADYRLYTSKDLRHRLAAMLPDCMLLDTPDWDNGSDDFEYEGCRYDFATWAFRKVGQSAERNAVSAQIRLGGAHWKGLLREERRLAVESERERAAIEQHAALLQQNLAVVTGKLDALLQDLRLEEGPKALRIVMPVARLIRRVHYLLHPPRVAPPPPPPSLGPSVTPPRKMGRRLAHWAALAAFRLVRPVARPVAWRLRGFLIGGLSEEVRRLGEQIDRDAGAATEMRHLAVEEMRQLAVDVERALLTLAMERAPDPWPAAALVRPGSVLTPPHPALRLPHDRAVEAESGPGDMSVSASLRASGGDAEPHVPGR